jgi:hypothetical protein
LTKNIGWSARGKGSVRQSGPNGASRSQADDAGNRGQVSTSRSAKSELGTKSQGQVDLLPLASCPSRDQDQFAVIVKIGVALGVVYVSETSFVEGFGPILGAVVYVLDPTFFCPSVSSSVPDAIVCAVVAAKRSRGRLTGRATTERNYAGCDWAPFGQVTEHSTALEACRENRRAPLGVMRQRSWASAPTN